MNTTPRGVTRKRGPILRVRTGCLTCRTRKKKCDETKPVCAGCKRNRLDCQWPTSTHRDMHSGGLGVASSQQGNDDHQSLSMTDESSTSPEEYSDIGRPLPFDDGSSSSMWYPQDRASGWEQYPATSLPSTADAGYASQVNETDGELQNDDSIVRMKEEPASPSMASSVLYRAHDYYHRQQGGTEAITKKLSQFPDLENRSVELLSYYLSRTSLSMFNGSTESNPFVDQLIPLSYSNNFILRLILSQSASHRAIAENHSKALAQKDYIMSLRSFQDAINDYVSGHEPSPLWVTLGALIMCFTETAKGDMNGVIFEHLKATGPLLAELVANPKHAISDQLKAFIVEYYVYTVAMSMISVDPASKTLPFSIRPEVEIHAQQLVTNGYTGPLCGCWLPLLLLIPRIFELGQRSMTPGIKPSFPTADDFIAFSLIQSQILSFVPAAPLGSDVAICGYVHQHAIHLYLLTSIGGYHGMEGLQRSYITESVDQAFYYLEQISPTSRVNTSIGWALAVIGACITDEYRRNQLRSHLEAMFHTLGLGNIRATIQVLEIIWSLPITERSPWTICRVMQEHSILISFA